MLPSQVVNWMETTFICQVGDEKEQVPGKQGHQDRRGRRSRCAFSTGVGVLLKLGPGGPSPFSIRPNLLQDTPHSM